MIPSAQTVDFDAAVLLHARGGIIGRNRLAFAKTTQIDHPLAQPLGNLRHCIGAIIRQGQVIFTNLTRVAVFL